MDKFKDEQMYTYSDLEQARNNGYNEGVYNTKIEIYSGLCMVGIVFLVIKVLF